MVQKITSWLHLWNTCQTKSIQSNFSFFYRGIGLFLGLELVTDREKKIPATEAAALLVKRYRTECWTVVTSCCALFFHWLWWVFCSAFTMWFGGPSPLGWKRRIRSLQVQTAPGKTLWSSNRRCASVWRTQNWWCNALTASSKVSQRKPSNLLDKTQESIKTPVEPLTHHAMRAWNNFKCFCSNRWGKRWQLTGKGRHLRFV